MTSFNYDMNFYLNWKSSAAIWIQKRFLYQYKNGFESDFCLYALANNARLSAKLLIRLLDLVLVGYYLGTSLVVPVGLVYKLH